MVHVDPLVAGERIADDGLVERADGVEHARRNVGAVVAICAIKAPVNGVSGALLRTTVLPVARAWVTFQMLVMNGAFHGVIAATTP